MRVALIARADENGLDLARRIGSRGAAVLLGCRDAQEGATLAATLRAEGINAIAMMLDETQPASIARAALKIDADFGKLDVLVHHGAVQVAEGMSALLAKSDLRRVIVVRDDLPDPILHLDPDWFESLR